METKNIIKKLEELPNKIRELSLSTTSKKFEVNDIIFKKEIIESKIIEEVLNEKNESKKPLYTNEKSREVEIFKRLNNNKEYSALKNKISILKNEIDIETIEIKYLYNQLTTIKCLFLIKDTGEEQ